MGSNVPDKLVNELHRSHPYTLITLLVLLGYAIWSFNSHATSTEVTLMRYAFEHQLAELQRNVDEQRQALNAVHALTLAGEIREQQHLVCAATDAAAKYGLQRYVDALQDRYTSLTGAPATTVQCVTNA